jgi:hypothetical protein
MRCDCCQRDYLPQHMHREGRRWWWLCGNCKHKAPRAYGVVRGYYMGRDTSGRARLRHRYKLHPPMLKALGFDA